MRFPYLDKRYKESETQPPIPLPFSLSSSRYV